MVSRSDTPERYGVISRGFHWLMAAIFAWQFAGALLYVGIGDTPLTRFVGGSHFSTGFALFVLVLFRGAWGLLNLRRRPARSGRVGKAAVGHTVFYALMVVIPGIAPLRQFDSGEEFSPFGIPVMPDRPYKIEWMIDAYEDVYRRVVALSGRESAATNPFNDLESA